MATTIPIEEVYCPCCGVYKPRAEFSPGATLCASCSMITAHAASITTRETCRREADAKKVTANGRKAARVEVKIAEYRRVGKRCYACHHRKPPEAYNKCATQGDGLQPICRSCNQIMVSTMREGGKPRWIQVRDALRAASPEGK